MKTLKTRRIGGSEESPDLYDLGMATLLELGRLWKLSIPEIKVYRRKTETRSMRTQSFVKENPKAGDINYGMIAHGNDKSRNTVIRDVIAR